MPNNIIMLDEELRRRALEKRQEANENFEDTELTADEKKVLAEMDQEAHTIVTENAVSTPITEYAAPLDKKISMVGAEGARFKQVNVGDIKQSVEDLKVEERERALRTFRDLSVSSEDLSDDAIVSINNGAIMAVAQYIGAERPTAEMVNKHLGKLPLRKLIEILPRGFVSLYITEAEEHANNSRARERLISALIYLTTIGPEMDYLNEYIENGHRLNLVTQRLIQCSVDLVAALKSEETLSAIADRAAELDPPKDLPWEKYIEGDTRRVHNMFAQNAAIHEMYMKAYTKLKDEYDDMESLTLIQEQIDESKAKFDIYSSICRLDLFKDMAEHVRVWLTMNQKFKYADLEREAISALDRIRRSKQDVPFPTYRAILAKNVKEQYANYMKEFPAMLARYNSALFQIQDEVRKDGGTDDMMPRFITIEGIMENTVHHYFSMLLLIVFGRIMKKLTSNTATKYDAITLDEYFVLYCSIGTDTYLMDDVWTIMEPLVAHAIKAWPRTTAKKGGKR